MARRAERTLVTGVDLPFTTCDVQRDEAQPAAFPAACVLRRDHDGDHAFGWKVRLPFTTALSMNHRNHHMVTARLRKQWRSETATRVGLMRIPPVDFARIELHYVPADARRRDAINLAESLKPIEDGIVDAGVVPDDTPEFIEPTMPKIHLPVRDLFGGRFWTFIVDVRRG